MKLLWLIVISFSLTRGLLAQNLIVNGNFEQPALPIPSWKNYTVGQNISGWQVSEGNVDLVSALFYSTWPSQTLDLNGLAPGAVEQTVQTIPGSQYQLSWKFNQNFTATNPDPHAEVLWNGIKVYEWTRPRGSFPFETLSITVFGSGLDSLAFRSLQTAPDGAFVLDDISLVLIPEPTAGSLLLAAFAALVIRRTVIARETSPNSHKSVPMSGSIPS